MIEEKGIYSIEKFLVSRRLMYWQVYLHKTVLCAEKMMVNIIKRAKAVNAQSPSDTLNIFLGDDYKQHGIEKFLTEFCNLDDYDLLNAIKHWIDHPDIVLSFLCKGLIDRELLKVKYFSRPVPDELLNKKKIEVCKKLNLSSAEASYITFAGETENKTYNTLDEHIHILFKDGTIKDISEVDNALIHQSLFGTVKKFYICYIA
jgi:HD superfamily phosphohydrolase